MCNTTVLGHLSRLKHLVLTFTLWLFLYFFSSIHLVPRLATDFLVRLVDLTGNFEIKICNHLTFHRQRKFDHLHSLIDSLISFCSSLFLCGYFEHRYSEPLKWISATLSIIESLFELRDIIPLKKSSNYRSDTKSCQHIHILALMIPVP